MGHISRMLALLAIGFIMGGCAHYKYQAEASDIKKDGDAQAAQSPASDATKVASRGSEDQKRVVIDNGVMFDPFGLATANLRRIEAEELAIKMGRPYASSAHGGVVGQGYGYGAYGMAYDPALAAADAYATQSTIVVPGTAAAQTPTATSASAEEKADNAVAAQALAAQELARQAAEIDKLKAAQE